MSFETLGLAPVLLSALRDEGFDTPTSVQAAAIPQALAGRDLMVSSQTGSGKTAAFMLPALDALSRNPPQGGRGVQVLVLTPTRELAMQVADATSSYGRHISGLRVATVVGGMPYGAQLKALGRRVDVLVATPGRLIDHLQAKRVNLSTVHTLVLDEADRMLDMGFIEDIETIIARTPKERQTLLFSATLDGTVAHLAAKMMNNPQRIEIASAQHKHTNITQHLLYADDNAHKLRLLDHLLRDSTLNQAIVFTATKRGADSLADHLSDEGFAAAALHGDMNQRQRTRTLGMVQKGRVRVLVATDVAARGIDVQSISHAFNYDLPMQAEDYVHRIGRTGRAGNDGQAITLATHAERHKVRRIEHFIGQAIPTEVIAGLEPQRSVRPTYKDRPKKGPRPTTKPGARPYAGKRAAAPRSADSRYAPAGKRADQAAPFERGDRPARTEYAAKPGYAPRPERGDRPARSDRHPAPAREGYAPRHDRSAGAKPGRPAKSDFKREGGRPSTRRPSFA
ncbi:MAG: DEAD/DEAH box helicase [Alcaligenaceae bacterium]|nr:DEAD/DEAH box helicase [Alcaligenaceae bacterium]